MPLGRCLGSLMTDQLFCQLTAYKVQYSNIYTIYNIYNIYTVYTVYTNYTIYAPGCDGRPAAGRAGHLHGGAGRDAALLGHQHPARPAQDVPGQDK